MPGTHAPLEVRFWRKVRKTDTCWLFGAGCADVHRRIRARDENGRQYTVLAHRLAWELANGPVPAGLCVCHRCDNPPCVNPAHLFLGTIGDNNRDCHAKGRGYSHYRNATHCIHGHALSGDNVYLSQPKDGRGEGTVKRLCRTCRKIRSASRARTRIAASTVGVHP